MAITIFPGSSCTTSRREATHALSTSCACTSAATPTFRGCAKAGRRAILVGVPADERAASRAHDARTHRPHPPHRGCLSRCFFPGAERRRFRARAPRGQDRVLYRRRGRGRTRELAGAVARLARGGRADADPVPQRDARLGRFGHRRAAPWRLQRVRPRRHRRSEPAGHDRRRRAPFARRIRQLLDVSEAPILLSHSNAFALCDHPRNAPDDVLRRLKDNGGVVMATFVPGFLSQALRDWLKRSRDGAPRRRSEAIRRRKWRTWRRARAPRRARRSPT